MSSIYGLGDFWGVRNGAMSWFFSVWIFLRYSLRVLGSFWVRWLCTWVTKWVTRALCAWWWLRQWCLGFDLFWVRMVGYVDGHSGNNDGQKDSQMG